MSLLDSGGQHFAGAIDKSHGVIHDHSNGSFQQFCTGVLAIRRAGISFVATGNADRFQAATAEIQDAKPNKLRRGTFHIRTTTRNYNFAPTSVQPDAESALVVRLLGK